jgi:hypothetical protein
VDISFKHALDESESTAWGLTVIPAVCGGYPSLPLGKRNKTPDGFPPTTGGNDRRMNFTVFYDGYPPPA